MSKPKKNWGKEIKDLGVLLIIVGAVMVALIFFMFTGDGTSLLASLIGDHILFLSVGGGVLLIAGIITRSIGKSKEMQELEVNKAEK